MIDRLTLLPHVASGDITPEQADFLLTPPGQPEGWISTKWEAVKTHLALHEKYGLFIFLAYAFVICRNEGYGIPEELLRRIEDHFQRLVEAKTKEDGLSALGFESNKIGGAWQGKAAITIFEQDNIINLVNQAIGYKIPKHKAFEFVANVTGRKTNAVKLLHYKGPRRKKRR